MTNKPLISVILPVYNCGKYAAEAINSVFNQTYTNLELICVNDGSKDNSLDVLKSFGDKIILIDSPKNQGIAASRNAGVAQAKGEFLAFMDADDIWTKNKLELQMEEFDKQPNLDVVFCQMECFLSPELPEEIKKLRHCPKGPMAGILSAAAIVKKTVFDSVGPFNTSWTVGEFIDWFERAKGLGHKYQMVEQVLLLRRIHETNTGVVARSSRADYVRIVKAALDRKRAK